MDSFNLQYINPTDLLGIDLHLDTFIYAYLNKGITAEYSAYGVASLPQTQFDNKTFYCVLPNPILDIKTSYITQNLNEFYNSIYRKNYDEVSINIIESLDSSQWIPQGTNPMPSYSSATGIVMDSAIAFESMGNSKVLGLTSTKTPIYYNVSGSGFGTQGKFVVRIGSTANTQNVNFNGTNNARIDFDITLNFEDNDNLVLSSNTFSDCTIDTLSVTPLYLKESLLNELKVIKLNIL